MKCKDLQDKLQLYTDRFIGEDDKALVKSHLVACPVCRQRHSEFREVQYALRKLQPVEISAAVKNSVKRVVFDELGSTRRPTHVSSDLNRWLQLRIMPFGVGVFASLAVAFTFLSLMFSGAFQASDPYDYSLRASHTDPPVLLAGNTNPYRNRSDLSAPDYAFSRADVASESPSVNPNGALVALTKSLIKNGVRGDEVVVVADVFGDGLAQIAEVVEPSRDRKAVGELQKALDTDPAYAPFVPANLDRRSDNLRVVLKFQSVDVSTSSKHRKKAGI